MRRGVGFSVGCESLVKRTDRLVFAHKDGWTFDNQGWRFAKDEACLYTVKILKGGFRDQCDLCTEKDKLVHWL